MLMSKATVILKRGITSPLEKIRLQILRMEMYTPDLVPRTRVIAILSDGTLLTLYECAKAAAQRLHVHQCISNYEMSCQQPSLILDCP